MDYQKIFFMHLGNIKSHSSSFVASLISTMSLVIVGDDEIVLDIVVVIGGTIN